MKWAGWQLGNGWEDGGALRGCSGGLMPVLAGAAPPGPIWTYDLIQSLPDLSVMNT